MTYDANGNAITRNGAGITWTSYNKPSQINGNGQVSNFWYAPDRRRWKQEATYCSGDETTIYAGGLLEKQTVGTATTYKHLIHAPDGNRIQQVLRDDGTSDTFYIATDHLGSSDVILKNSAVHVYTSFDAFGQRRDPTDWTSPISSGDWPKIKSATRRGFTGHEHLDNVGLIHMNGRVQDPLVGRFLSADPFVQAPYFSESLNRYSYTFNSPLSYTDPSGFNADEPRRVWVDLFREYYFLEQIGILNAHIARANWAEYTATQRAMMRAEMGLPTATFNRPYTAIGQPDVWDFTVTRVAGCTAGGESTACHGIDTRPPLPNIDWEQLANDWWPGYAIGTCVYDGNCGTLQWSMAIIGALPQGKGTGAILPTPRVSNPKLQNIVSDLYRGTTNPRRVGTGTTADAVRNELLTGVPTAGKWHNVKAADYSRALEKWLAKNPNAPYNDRLVAQSLLEDLRNALRTGQ